jgi:hypothetical protein
MSFDISLVGTGSFDISLAPAPVNYTLNITDNVGIVDFILDDQEVDFIFMSSVTFGSPISSECWNAESSTFKALKDGTYSFNTLINWESNPNGRRRIQFEYKDASGIPKHITNAGQTWFASNMVHAKDANVFACESGSDEIYMYSGTDYSTITTIDASPEMSGGVAKYMMLTDDGTALFVYILSNNSYRHKIYKYSGAGWATKTMVLDLTSYIFDPTSWPVEFMRISGDGSVFAFINNTYPDGFPFDTPRLTVFSGASFATVTHLDCVLTDFDSWGAALAISGDGTVIAVGDPLGGNPDGSGYVDVYSGASYGTRTRLTPNVPVLHNGYFGGALDLSYDGSVLVVGAYWMDIVGDGNYNSNTHHGAVYIRHGTAWADEVVHFPPCKLLNYQLGSRVRVSGDGKVVYALCGYDYGDTLDYEQYYSLPAGSIFRYSGTDWDTMKRFSQKDYFNYWSNIGDEYWSLHEFEYSSGGGRVMNFCTNMDGSKLAINEPDLKMSIESVSSGVVTIIDNIDVKAVVASNEVPSNIAKIVTKQGLSATLYMKKDDTLSVEVAHNSTIDINVLPGSSFKVIEVSASDVPEKGRRDVLNWNLGL